MFTKSTKRKLARVILATVVIGTVSACGAAPAIVAPAAPVPSTVTVAPFDHCSPEPSDVAGGVEMICYPVGWTKPAPVAKVAPVHTVKIAKPHPAAAAHTVPATSAGATVVAGHAGNAPAVAPGFAPGENNLDGNGQPVNEPAPIKPAPGAMIGGSDAGQVTGQGCQVSESTGRC